MVERPPEVVKGGQTSGNRSACDFRARRCTILEKHREHPLAPVPGWSEDDPLFGEWQEAIEAYRRQVDDDSER
jgi:hypothetical protein